MLKSHINLYRMGFYFITDSLLTKKGVEEDVKDALQAGVKIIQYREKNKNARKMLEEVLRIKHLCKGKAVFLINDRVDIALAADVDGVHLGQEDLPCPVARMLLGEQKIIGITVHNTEEAIKAEKQGADYIGASPIFETQTKKDAGRQAGLQLIKDVRAKVRIPIVAIGGINLENIVSVMEAGAHTACAISAVISEEKTQEECRKFVEIIDKFTKNFDRQP